MTTKFDIRAAELDDETWNEYWTGVIEADTLVREARERLLEHVVGFIAGSKAFIGECSIDFRSRMVRAFKAALKGETA